MEIAPIRTGHYAAGLHTSGAGGVRGAESDPVRPIPESRATAAVSQAAAAPSQGTATSSQGTATSSQGTATSSQATPETSWHGPQKISSVLPSEAEVREIQKLAKRDREVRAHEQAHASVGGAYAGSPSYQFQRGANGVSYAVGGHVSIDVSAVDGDPAATLQKMITVQRAALAPQSPSPQDRAVAARASRQAADARVALAEVRLEEGYPQPGDKIEPGKIVDVSA